MSECHGKEKPKGDLDLSGFQDLESVARRLDDWEAVLEQLESGAMPPAKARQHPSAELKQESIGWIKAMRKREATRHAGDPGRVRARRLSNAEYDHTIRDLTGVDIRPTQEFPIDPANEAGFDNSAESLAMSPALLKKYLEAARRVADHMVLNPEGIAFADHPVVADTDRDKYCVRRIIAFYQRQRIDYADYFEAAWRYRHRAALGKPGATLADHAAEMGISRKYLALIWPLLTESTESIGPIAALQALWSALPPPGADRKVPAEVRPVCDRMRDLVVELRRQLVLDIKNLTAPTVHNGSQNFVLWKNRQYAANRRRYTGGGLEINTDVLKLEPGSAAARALEVPDEPATAARFEAGFTRFCATFPDEFYVSERARVYLNAEKEKKNVGRLLSAGFHSMTGFFRDDGPLYDLMLEPDQQRELDRLWQDLDFIASAPMRQYSSFLWFERTDSSYLRDPEFDFARAEDKIAMSEGQIRRLSEIYLAKARRNGASDVALQAINDQFRIINASIRWVEQARVDAEPRHVAALQDLAQLRVPSSADSSRAVGCRVVLPDAPWPGRSRP